MRQRETLPSESHPAVDMLADLVTREDGAIDVPTAALAIARVHYPELDPLPHLESLRRLSGDAADHMAAAGCEDTVEGLSSFFSGTLGFHGNAKDFDDPRNSFLNDVLVRRTGLPITLAIVYIELASACGVECEGIGFPGHFLVRELDGGRVIDPFHKGRELSEQDCHRLLERQGLPSDRWRDEFLQSAGKGEILTRILNNLHRYYSATEDNGRLGVVIEMVRVVRASHRDGGGMMH